MGAAECSEAAPEDAFRSHSIDFVAVEGCTRAVMAGVFVRGFFVAPRAGKRGSGRGKCGECFGSHLCICDVFLE